MQCQLRVFLTAILSASLLTYALASDKSPNPPSQTNYLITNDDGLLHNYLSFFTPGGTQGAPTLNFAFDVNAVGLGIGGGYFAAPRVNMLNSPTTQCVYASNGGTGDISGVNIQTQQLAGPFAGSTLDSGDANGIGIVLNANYLYAGYSASNTIGTFAVQAGCQLSFLGDTPAAGLNGGGVAGMALHGNMMVVSYADGSIESFNVSEGMPVSNGDAQNSTGYTMHGISFPEGVDITSDGHFAIFGDSAINTTVEVSDISSGRLTATVPYTFGGPPPSVPPNVGGVLVSPTNSGVVRLSPDESLIYVGNNDGGSVSALFFNTQTGAISGGCRTQALTGFYNPWAFTGSIATRDNTGTGGVLYVAEYGFSGTGSFIGVLNINSNGTACTLTESSASEVPDHLSSGLLSITTYPPRSF